MGKTLYGYADKIWEIVEEFEYTGEPQPFTLTPGEYLLICHGAMGFSTPSESAPYSFGGAAYGILNIDQEQRLYAYVGGNGGIGTKTEPGKGGWNGGADGGYSRNTSYVCGNGGGGASDIRLYSETDFDEDGENKSLLSRIIVAGGAGGRGWFNVADWMFAFGGGINGGYYGGIGGNLGNDPNNKKYASQTDGYSFGKGMVPIRSTGGSNGEEGSGGGGGGWFGGYSTSVGGQYCSMSGGGGSGYVLTEESFKPSGYIPSSKFYLKDPCLQPCQSSKPIIMVLKETDKPPYPTDKIIIPFTGKPTKLNLYAGEYRFKCWGGEGGRRFYSNYKRSYGGYSEGVIDLPERQDIWCHVGGSGLLANRTTSDVKLFNPDMGYNGGGNPVYNNETLFTGSGGGATDFRICSVDEPLRPVEPKEGVQPPSSSEEQSLLSRIIVAGGGGSEGYAGTSYGGQGGGLTGGTISASKYGTHGGPGTQTSSPPAGDCSGGFGYGGNSKYKDSGIGGAGGGGWFGGSGTVPDGSGDNDSAGAGGSGYILTAESFKPNYYIPDERYYFKEGTTITGGNTLMPNVTKAEVDIIKYDTRFVVLDSEGYKIFNKDLNAWEYYNDEMTKEEIKAYGCNQFVNFDGVLDEFDIIVYDEYDMYNSIEIDHICKEESVTMLIPINFPIVNKFIDYEYDPEKYTFRIEIKPYDSEHKALIIYIDKLVVTDEKFKLYSIQLYSK